MTKRPSRLSPPDGGKRIAFSFDDAPRRPGEFLSARDRTSRLITGLAAAGVGQAAFFVVAGNFEQPWGRGRDRGIAEYVAAGHVLGNHSFSHPALSSTRMEDYLTDVDRATAWLSQRRGYRPWYRYPYLDEADHDTAKKRCVRAALRRRGLANAYITVRSGDHHLDQLAGRAHRAGETMSMAALRDLYAEVLVGSAEFYNRAAVRALGRYPAHVILLHETDLNALFIVDVVAAFQRAGWEVIPIDHAYQDPMTRIETGGWCGSGRVAALSLLNGAAPADLVYQPVERASLLQAFSTRVLRRVPARQPPPG